MKIFAFLSLIPLACFAFAPSTRLTKKTTKLQMVDRREMLATGLAFLAVGPATAYQSAYQSQAGIGSDRIFARDDEIVAAQQATGDKLDLNSAFVGDYKQLPGMFPSAAGKIASHGPYEKVKDIYSIEGLTKHDKDMFKKYERYFTALPASPRTFNERINARVST